MKHEPLMMSRFQCDHKKNHKIFKVYQQSSSFKHKNIPKHTRSTYILCDRAHSLSRLVISAPSPNPRSSQQKNKQQQKKKSKNPIYRSRHHEYLMPPHTPTPDNPNKHRCTPNRTIWMYRKRKRTYMARNTRAINKPYTH